MNKHSKEKRFELSEPEILAFEREKQDIKILKEYRSKKKANKIRH